MNYITWCHRLICAPRSNTCVCPSGWGGDRGRPMGCLVGFIFGHTIRPTNHSLARRLNAMYKEEKIYVGIFMELSMLFTLSRRHNGHIFWLNILIGPLLDYGLKRGIRKALKGLLLFSAFLSVCGQPTCHAI